MKLTYYKEKKDGKQIKKGILNFENLKCSVKIKDSKKFRFDLVIKGLSRAFMLRALNEEDYSDWIKALTISIENSNGYKHNLFIEERQLAVKAWRYDFIHEIDFLS